MKRPHDEEASLFRESVRDVKRLPAREPPPGRRKPAARARSAARSLSIDADDAGTHPSAPLAAGDSLAFVRSGTTRAILRDLRRGRLRVEAVLDLHGLPVARAERALEDFLAGARGRGLQCVRIVHGKGLHSGVDRPALKNMVDGKLRSARAVLAFASTRPVDGGAGAVNVLLAR